MATPDIPNETPRTERVSQMTPKNTTPIQPDAAEMHPQHFQTSTAKPLEEARWLGFSAMGPHTEPVNGRSRIAIAQATPTKPQKTQNPFSSPDFQFTFKRQSLELSADAQKMMAEKREEAAKMREQMIAQGEGPHGLPSIAETIGRKIATAKGKAGRYSDVHMAEFKKMDSIANHPSAFRAAPSRLQQATTSLKRTMSKAKLDEPEQPVMSSLKRTKPAARSHKLDAGLTRPKSTFPAKSTREEEASGPMKRVKHQLNDDTSAARPVSRDTSDESKPATPNKSNLLCLHPSNPHLPDTTMPTGPSLSRAGSIKQPKTTTMIPSLARSPSKATVPEAAVEQPKAATTPLLSRSPSKMSFASTTAIDRPRGMMDVAPVRAPATSSEKGSNDQAHITAAVPLLARSPQRMAAAEPAAEHSAPTSIPFLARSPSKLPTAETNPLRPCPTTSTHDASSIPFLTRSPSKISVSIAGAPTSPSKQSSFTPGNLMSRFSLLRHSPIKSILRSPQRLYSDDPFKVANGTHLTPPPPAPKSKDLNVDKDLPDVPPAAVQKHVDFTASTLDHTDRDGDVDVDMNEASPSSVTPPSLPHETSSIVVKHPFAYPQLLDYPTLPPTAENDAIAPVPASSASTTPPTRSKAKPEVDRRTTLAALPGDFTFRSTNPISFGPATSGVAIKPSVAPKSSGHSIRRVAGSDLSSINTNGNREKQLPPLPSAVTASTVAAAGKKRKLDAVPDLAAAEEARGVEGKENHGDPAGEGADEEEEEEEEEEEPRPAKKARSTGAGVSAHGNGARAGPAKPPTSSRLPRFGGGRSDKTGAGKGGQGRDGGGEKGRGAVGMLSQARLNMLALPKRRRE
ncbi:hypothetical protein B0A49_08157 [Cryomyces minteri]|uniref:Uncharacterized protein n=1 Tax=Cryomyces minteri TaxID=331657 RepID=A0A4V6WKV4_9PEZI|nr:hypothetical protein B0A49_11666 [Cryomyces minteri]TKA71745.1 hypothetical protein B0A49_08157 [Cryomyces minteri]